MKNQPNSQSNSVFTNIKKTIYLNRRNLPKVFASQEYFSKFVEGGRIKTLKKLIMRQFAILILLTVLAIINSCSQQEPPVKQAKTAETESQVKKTVVPDHTLTKDQNILKVMLSIMSIQQEQLNFKESIKYTGRIRLKS